MVKIQIWFGYLKMRKIKMLHVNHVNPDMLFWTVYTKNRVYGILTSICHPVNPVNPIERVINRYI